MPNFMLLSRCENVWPFLTLRALTTCIKDHIIIHHEIMVAPMTAKLLS